MEHHKNMKDRFNVYIQQINTHLQSLFPKMAPDTYKNLFEAAEYSISTGGKRLRPLLALLTIEMFGYDLQSAMEMICTVELIHTFSLIHDDLPGMDNDDMRRGKPTLHKVYPEGHAILTGDFLLVHAFEILAKLKNTSAEKKIELISILSSCTGGQGMIGGQVIDMNYQGKQANLSILEEKDYKKTGALMVAPLLMGAVWCDRTAEEKKILETFGYKLGLCFQIADDLIDLRDDPQGSDAIHQKSTYISLLGVEGAKKHMIEVAHQAIGLLQSLNFNTEHFEYIIHYIIESAK